SQSRATAEKPISSIACIYSVLFLLMAWWGPICIGRPQAFSLVNKAYSLVWLELFVFLQVLKGSTDYFCKNIGNIESFGS
ncbi:MAG: hypothetical protein ACI3ZY_05630, partial [Parabacteroides sp.]